MHEGRTGHCCITVDNSQSTRFEPIKPYTDEQMCCAMNTPTLEPVVNKETREIEIKMIQRVTSQADHRFYDGAHIARIRNCAFAAYADPEGFNADDFPDYPNKAE